MIEIAGIGIALNAMPGINKLILGNIFTSLVQGSRNNAVSKEIAEKQRFTQLQVALLNIEAQKALEITKLNNQFILDNNNHAFQKRMAELGFNQKLSLQQIEQAFLREQQILGHEFQKNLEEYKATIQYYLSNKNENFQRWKFEQEETYRKNQNQYLRETNLLVEKERKTAAAYVEELGAYLKQSWPLKNTPSIYNKRYFNQDISGLFSLDLFVFISPPVIMGDEFIKENHSNFPVIESILANFIKENLINNYSEKILLDDGSWISKKFHGNSALKPLAYELRYNSFIVIESNIISGVGADYIEIKIAYKVPGAEETSYNYTINLPYKKILQSLAIERAKSWEKHKQLQTSDINNNLPEDESLVNSHLHNLNSLKKEEFINTLSLEYSKKDFQYQIWPEDNIIIIDILSIFHCIIIGWTADIHYFLQKDVAPSFIKIFGLLTKKLPSFVIDKGIINIHNILSEILDSYIQVFNQSILNKGNILPHIIKELAQDVYNLEMEENDNVLKLLNLSVETWCDYKNTNILTPKIVSSQINNQDMEYLMDVKNLYKKLSGNEPDKNNETYLKFIELILSKKPSTIII